MPIINQEKIKQAQSLFAAGQTVVEANIPTYCRCTLNDQPPAGSS
ncbi:hypothetical protein [Trichloromonas acetexigens]|nr:hypothetical protein [Desulfuromonas acetexigens]